MSGFLLFRCLQCKESPLIASIALLALFFVCMVYDLRNHQVPIPLTAGGMIGAGVYALSDSIWAPVLLMIALTHVSDFNPQEKRLAFVLMYVPSKSYSYKVQSIRVCW